MKESPLKFAMLTALIFEGVLASVATTVSGEMRLFLIIALVVLPLLVLGAFFYLLSYQTHKLYAPADFSSESSFLKAAAGKSSDEAVFFDSAHKITETASSKIRAIVSAQIETLSVYHNLIINNARRSFQSAFISAIVGILFLVVAVLFVLLDQSRDASVISSISGALVEVVAGINFYLYNKASKQLAEFQIRLETIQRYVLADAICDTLDNEYQQRARSMLVLSITGEKVGSDFSSIFGKIVPNEANSADAKSRAAD